MATAVAARNVSTQLAATFAEIEKVVSDHSLATVSQEGHWTRAFLLAEGVKQLREKITKEMMDQIIPLFNTSLGFRADKESYPAAVVKDCLIEALLRGAYPVGNEFNIISGRCYLTKEFYMRALGEIPGVTSIVASPGLPIQKDGRTVVRFALSWKRDGKLEQLLDHEGKPGRVFEIRVNSGMGSDAIIGKAFRKAYKAAYEQITGSQLEPDSELDGATVTDAIDVSSTSTRKTSMTEIAGRNGNNDGELASLDQLDALEDFRDRHNKAFVAAMQKRGKDSPSKLTHDEASQVIRELKALDESGSSELFGTAKEASAY